MRIDRSELYPNDREPASELLRELYAFSALVIAVTGLAMLLFGWRG